MATEHARVPSNPPPSTSACPVAGQVLTVVAAATLASAILTRQSLLKALPWRLSNSCATPKLGVQSLRIAMPVIPTRSTAAQRPNRSLNLTRSGLRPPRAS